MQGTSCRKKELNSHLNPDNSYPYQAVFCRDLLQHLHYLLCKKSNSLWPSRAGEGLLSPRLWNISWIKTKSVLKCNYPFSVPWNISTLPVFPYLHFMPLGVRSIFKQKWWIMVMVLQPLRPYISQKALYQWRVAKSIFAKTSATPWGFLYTHTMQAAVPCYGASVCMHLFSFFLLALFRLEYVFLRLYGSQTRVAFLEITHNPCQAWI